MILEKKEVFGEEDLVHERQYREYSVRCESAEGKVLQISKEDFLNRIFCIEACNDYLLEQVERKDRIFAEKIKLMERQMHRYETFFYSDAEKNAHHLSKFIGGGGGSGTQSLNADKDDLQELFHFRNDKRVHLMRQKRQIIHIKNKLLASSSSSRVKIDYKKLAGKQQTEGSSPKTALRPLQSLIRRKMEENDTELELARKNNDIYSPYEDMSRLMKSDMILAKNLITKQMGDFSVATSHKKSKGIFKTLSHNERDEIAQEENKIEQRKNSHPLGNGKALSRLNQLYRKLMTVLAVDSESVVTQNQRRFSSEYPPKTAEGTLSIYLNKTEESAEQEEQHKSEHLKTESVADSALLKTSTQQNQSSSTADLLKFTKNASQDKLSIKTAEENDVKVDGAKVVGRRRLQRPKSVAAAQPINFNYTFIERMDGGNFMTSAESFEAEHYTTNLHTASFYNIGTAIEGVSPNASQHTPPKQRQESEQHQRDSLNEGAQNITKKLETLETDTSAHYLRSDYSLAQRGNNASLLQDITKENMAIFSNSILERKLVPRKKSAIVQAHSPHSVKIKIF